MKRRKRPETFPGRGLVGRVSHGIGEGVGDEVAAGHTKGSTWKPSLTGTASRALAFYFRGRHRGGGRFIRSALGLSYMSPTQTGGEPSKKNT